MSDRQRYATTTAIYHARELALPLGHADWRAAFLAITDFLMGESASSITARRLGPVRDGRERWELQFPQVSVEVIYDPATALFMSLVPPRPDSLGKPHPISETA